MKVDLYTKIVLTVIALTLSFIALRENPTEAHARDIMDVRVVEVEWNAFWQTEPIKVICEK